MDHYVEKEIEMHHYDDTRPAGERMTLELIKKALSRREKQQKRNKLASTRMLRVVDLLGYKQRQQEREVLESRLFFNQSTYCVVQTM